MRLKKIRLVLFIFSIGLYTSCIQKYNKEYYENGSIKSDFVGDFGIGTGQKNIYYKNGGVKQVDFLVDKKIDSSVYYFEGRDKLIQERHLYNDSTIHIFMYNPHGQLTKRGKVLKNNVDSKIGKWIYSDYTSKMDSIVEYIGLNKKSHINQTWLRTFSGDTILGRGNYFEIIKSDNVSLAEPARIRFSLMEPYLEKHSDIMIIIPKNDGELDNNYSNLFEIDRDTLHSLKNDGIPRSGIPKEMPINHIVEFGIEYDDPGRYRIRGALIEYIYKDLENAKYPDSIFKVERTLFFDDSISIRPGNVPN